MVVITSMIWQGNTRGQVVVFIEEDIMLRKEYEGNSLNENRIISLTTEREKSAVRMLKASKKNNTDNLNYPR